MPRIYRNEIIVTGKEVPELLKHLGGDENGHENIDFSRVIEYPQQFKEMDDQAVAFAKEFDRIQNRYIRLATRSRKIYELTQKYKVSPETIRLPTGLENGGYEWQLENWGSSNAENVWIRLVKGEIGWFANIVFVTEGGVPTAVFEKLSVLFPDVGIWTLYRETGSKWEGHSLISEGVTLFRIRSKGFPLIISP